MRILGLDWGKVRIGGAVSDIEGKIAFPLDKFIKTSSAIDEIKKIINDSKIEKIIIGLPKSLDGESGISAKKVETFVKKIKAQIAIPVELVDERFSSVEAGKRLSSEGISEENQRTIKDNMAAQILLQQYLDRKGK